MTEILSKIPVEILQLIADELSDVRDLKSLTEVSRTIRSAVLALFWHAVEVSPRSEFYLHELPIGGLLHAPLGYMKHLSFQSSFHDHTFVRCPHASLDDNEREEFAHLALAAEAIVRRTAHGQLQSFRWNMGTCLPGGILGSCGIIPLLHSSLQALSLTTSYDCDGQHDCVFAGRHQCAIDLGPLRELRSFCWKAPRGEDLDTLSLAMRNNSQHLRSLELDFVDWEGLKQQHTRGFYLAGDAATHENHCVFSTKVLRLTSVPEAPLFCRLQDLSLSGIPVGADLATAIDFRKIRSLTMRKCFGWHILLEHIVEKRTEISLKTLEIQDCPHELSTSSGKQALARFVDSFRGLERLFVSFVGPSSREIDFWAYVVGHRDTLQRYVQHQRIYFGVDGPSWPCELDSTRLGLSKRDILRVKTEPSSNSLGSLNLECLGLACIPEHLKSIVSPFIPKSCLKMLHIRQSAQDARYRPWWAWERIAEPVDKSFQGTALDFTLSFTEDVQSHNHLRKRWRHCNALLDFVTWAFGSHGLDSLQFVVFGDFAHGGRETESQICFCRDGDAGAYVEIDRRDSRWRRMVRDYRDVLEACPSETLLYVT